MITKIVATLEGGSEVVLFPVGITPSITPEVIDVPLNTPIELHEELLPTPVDPTA